MTEPNCLPICSLCTNPPLDRVLKACGACGNRRYCDKKCQLLDWKLGGHKKHCKTGHADSPHQLWCAYLDRDPEPDDDCIVETNDIKENPKEVMTTGLNTCMFIVVKTKSEVLGWHASVESFRGRESKIRRKFSSISG